MSSTLKLSNCCFLIVMTGTVAAGGHSRDIRGTELIDHMNQNQISMIRLRADEVSLGNGDYAPALVQQFFYAGYNADLPGPSAQSFEIEEVEVTYRCAIEENIEYLAVVFLTDEEKEVPMITTKLIIIQYIVAIQLMHYHKAGEFIRGRRNAPLDREDTFEEPPIE